MFSIPICTGEWWNGEVQAIEDDMKMYGGGPNSSDAYTINGFPGSLYPCSNKGKIKVLIKHLHLHVNFSEKLLYV